jgi:sugar transferase (PEP-CTERM system associated)
VGNACPAKLPRPFGAREHLRGHSLIRFLHAYFPARTVFLGVSESCLVALAVVAAPIARLGPSDATLMLAYEQGVVKIVVASAAFITCMYYFDLYNSSILSNRREVSSRLIAVLGTACILLAFIYYVYPALELGRGIFAIGCLLVAVALLLWRKLFAAINSQPQFAERALILGDSPLALSILRELHSRPELGLRVVSHVLTDGDGTGQVNGDRREAAEESLESIACEELSRAVKTHRVNRIVVAMRDRRGKMPVELLLSLKSRGVLIQDGTDLYETVTGKVPIESLRLGWLLFSPGFHLSRLLMIYKRLASMLISIVGLLLSLPLLPFIAVAIKLTSRGPVFYRQKRVGRDGTVFYCYKFRTMCADAEADSGPTWAGDDDPRITRVGRFLRMSRLDEIPQLWNVLKGDMSLIGPRPERPEFVERLTQDIPYYHLRHTVRPGITGWAQVRYRYGSSIEDAKEKLRYDLFYIKNMSPGLDFLILFDTTKTILMGRGAK